MFLNGCFFTAVNAAFIAVCCFQTEQQSKFTSGTHSFDMQPHERTGEMRLSHAWLSLSDTVQLRLLKLNWLFFKLNHGYANHVLTGT